MAAITDPDNRMLKIIKQEAEITDENLSELRRLLSQLPSGTQSFFAGPNSNVAAFRMNIELIAAIRSFDQASANLITTTNKLTNRILILTYVVVGLGLISAIPVVLDFFRFH